MYTLRITGKTIRVCYEPYKPIFSHYGSEPLALLEDNDSITKVNGQFFVIYYQTIDRLYYLSTIPKGSPILTIKTDANNA